MDNEFFAPLCDALGKVLFDIQEKVELTPSQLLQIQTIIYEHIKNNNQLKLF